MHVLQLLGAAAGEVLVEVLPHAAEGLPQGYGLGPQTLRVRALHPRQQAIVEGVAVDGDLLHQRRQGHARIVGVRPVTADPRAHQDRAGQDGGRLEKHFFVGRRAAMLDAFQHGVQRHLLQHETAAAARVVQLAEVPLAEEIVRPLVHRMVEVVGARVDRQLLQQFGVEHRLELQRRVDAFEDRQGPHDQVMIAAHGHACPANEQWDRTHPLVGVGLDLLLRAEDRHRPVAKVIVQLPDRATDDAIAFIPRPPLCSTASQTRPMNNGWKRASSDW